MRELFTSQWFFRTFLDEHQDINLCHTEPTGDDTVVIVVYASMTNFGTKSSLLFSISIWPIIFLTHICVSAMTMALSTGSGL